MFEEKRTQGIAGNTTEPATPPKDTEPTTKQKAMNTFTVACSAPDAVLNVRTKPDIKSALVGEPLTNGTIVEVLETTDGWHRIAQGWIKADFCEAMAQDVTSTAKSAGRQNEV